MKIQFKFFLIVFAAMLLAISSLSFAARVVVGRNGNVGVVHTGYARVYHRGYRTTRVVPRRTTVRRTVIVR